MKRLSIERWTEEERVAAAYARWTPVYPWPRPLAAWSKAKPKPTRVPKVGLLLGSVALAVATVVLVMKAVG